jgi:hypothetical protein
MSSYPAMSLRCRRGARLFTFSAPGKNSSVDDTPARILESMTFHKLSVRFLISSADLHCDLMARLIYEMKKVNNKKKIKIPEAHFEKRLAQW